MPSSIDYRYIKKELSRMNVCFDIETIQDISNFIKDFSQLWILFHIKT